MSREKKQKRMIFRVVKEILKENLVITLLLLAVILLSIVVSVLPPLVLEGIVDRLVEHFSIGAGTIALYILLLVCSGILDSGREISLTVFGQRMTHGLRSRMAEKLAVLPTSYFTKQEAGTTVSRFVNDVNAVDSLFSSGIISMFIDAAKILSILLVIFTRSIGLGILILLVMPFLYVLTRSFQKRVLKAQLENRAAVGNASNLIPETIKNIRVIRLLRAEKYMTVRYEDSIGKSFQALEKSNLYDALYSPIIIITSTAITAIMMIASAQSGVVRTFFGMSVGTSVAMISYVGKIFGPLENIGMEIQNVQEAFAGVRRVEEFLQEEEFHCRKEPSEREDAPAAALRKICFSYKKGENELFHGLSLTVEQGEQITLVGRTGAGKSTLFKLLLGLYQPDEGSVEIFSRNPAAIPEEEKRKVYGYVEQQFRPVPGDIAAQISLGDPSVSEEEIRQSLEFVGLWKTVEELEAGVHTPYSDQLFSQGQVQLLSIARAVVKNPRLLLLDEITANLDSATEKQVLSALENASRNRTVLSISHRLFEQNQMKKLVIGQSVSVASGEIAGVVSG